MNRSALPFLLVMLMFAALVSAQDADEPEAGSARTDDFGIEQVWVPAGCFMMGTTEEQAADVLAQNPPDWVQRALPREQPQHEVCLTAGYWIDTFEVTNIAFQAFVEDGGYDNQDYWSPAGWGWLQRQHGAELPIQCIEVWVDDQPRVCVTWYEAEAYANWRGGSLPTEAQWEYAARGPDGLIYPWGNEWDSDLANVVDSMMLAPVGSYPDGARGGRSRYGGQRDGVDT